MHDVGYIIAGYAATAVGIVGYRWRLAARSRRATSLIRAAAGRKAAGTSR
ncbi:MAG TPA: hypothetical protein VFW65_25075 [Pseudonocardiaceae bacterium]|nr:hypothetical protein [Pseudonocardiaceae bacterium]